ncbi:MAG TPA: tRNA (guanosine(37)-N1)-methyltransferase TrmD [Sporichthyaceae bacterium]|nr:tRNA (guanosine(37)-N1)-methyltransferase TrmD [Sporichthyaceae bacterium]
MRIDVITIFPAYLEPLQLSLLGRAGRTGAVRIAVHDLRAWTDDVHRTVDDTPYGGGAGMLMRPEPWGAALDAVLDGEPGGPGAPARLIVPTPAGRVFDHRAAVDLAAAPWLVFACGRYEGIDSRVVREAAERPTVGAVDEISIGDYVLSGGEVAVLVILEAVARLLPGVVGNPDSLVEESHAAGLLEYPGYTKPATWRGRPVPEVLRSGDHAAIARWRRDAALRRTARVRPDLIRRLSVEACDAKDLATLAAEGWLPGTDGRFLAAGEAVAD